MGQSKVGPLNEVTQSKKTLVVLDASEEFRVADSKGKHGSRRGEGLCNTLKVVG